MPHVRRILDANANRAREALRVMEEAARFVLDDAPLCDGIKRLRHDLAAALVRIDALLPNRDTPGDVGVHIKTASEFSRESVSDVATAAGKRLSEALRAMEEYGKTIDPAFAAAIESLRYRGYDLERGLDLALGSGKARQWRLCVLISESLCRGRDWRDIARAAIAGGADCLQLREKSLDAGALLSRARELVTLARPHRVSVIINDRPDVALLSGADGVHLGQTDLPCCEARKLVGRQLIIGVSTSRLEEARQAQRDGADYCGVGPMFNTTTKHKDVIVGPAYLRQFTQWGQLPHLAIGGITPANVADLVAAGARGIAVSSAVCGADDPQRAAAALRAALDAPRDAAIDA
jgi:thiamine-phosphate pyrophosphorylase